MAEALSPNAAILRTLFTIGLSAAGGFCAELLDFPAGWLMGGALAVSVAALFGAPVLLPKWLRDFAFIATGLSMGATVSRDSLALIAQWPVTMLAMTIELVIIIYCTGWILRKALGVDRGTAYLSSFPGHLSLVMSIASTGVGDPRQIVIIQVMRLLLLTVLVPIGAIFLPVGSSIPHTGAPEIAIPNLIAVGCACAFGGWVLTRLKVPAGYVLGAMVTSIAARFGGVFDGIMPPALAAISFILIGTVIGTRFSGITMVEFRRAALGGLAGTGFAVAVVTLISWLSSLLVDMPFGQIWLGLSPGAIESMGPLGVALGYDSAFIAAHHVVRLLLLGIAIPIVSMLVREKT